MVSFAYAAPEFVGSEGDVAVARQAWGLAAACAGWDGRAAASVTIRRDLAKHAGPTGEALVNAQGLHTIRVSVDASPTVLAHELTHAWVHEGDRAVVEGLAGALTGCVQRGWAGVARGTCRP